LSRIAPAFAELKRDERRGFIPFITAGDPDLKTTRDLIVELAAAGATLIELGVPFTDPMADGPVIQRASDRALIHNFGLAEILQTVAEARQQTNVPIILFSYFNPLLQFCMDPDTPRYGKLAQAAKAAGIDGVLVTDLVPEEADQFGRALSDCELDMIFLVAPTSTDERLRMVASRASGFVYAVSRAGVTGAREEVSVEAEKLVQRIRQFSDLPIAVGFGISQTAQVKDVGRYADAVVVGSAIVREIERLGTSPDLVSRVGQFVRNLIGISA
jgi:tryptophan synthase alpha chain